MIANTSLLKLAKFILIKVLAEENNRYNNITILSLVRQHVSLKTLKISNHVFPLMSSLKQEVQGLRQEGESKAVSCTSDSRFSQSRPNIDEAHSLMTVALCYTCYM